MHLKKSWGVNSHLPWYWWLLLWISSSVVGVWMRFPLARIGLANVRSNVPCYLCRRLIAIFCAEGSIRPRPKHVHNKIRLKYWYCFQQDFDVGKIIPFGTNELCLVWLPVCLRYCCFFLSSKVYYRLHLVLVLLEHLKEYLWLNASCFLCLQLLSEIEKVNFYTNYIIINILIVKLL